MRALVVVVCAVAGLVLAPFLQRVVQEVPEGNLPRGPYRLGRATRDVALTVLNVVLFVLAALEFESGWLLVPALVLFASLLTVSVIDIELYRIPDRIVFPTLGLLLVLLFLADSALDLDGALGRGLIAAGVYFMLLFIPHLVYPRGMGFGDVKLALVMGLFLGFLCPDWPTGVYLVFASLMLGCLLGVVMGTGFRIVRRSGGAFPFGPALATATVVVALFAEQLIDNYKG